MAQQVKPSIPKGTRDFGPIEMAKRNYIFNTIKEVYALYGYQDLALRRLIDTRRETVGASDEEDEALGDRLHLLLQVLTELARGELTPPFVQENEDVTRLEALEEHICLTLFLLLLAEVLDILEVGQLLDAEWHIVREATLIVGNGLLRQLADGLTRKDDVELHDLRRWLGAPVVPRLE